MSRLSTRFGAVLHQAIGTFPWLSRVQMCYCDQADREHRKSWRQFAHSCHHKDIVCWAPAAETELTDLEIDGIAAHELGHIVADEMGLPAHRATRESGRRTPEVEDEANRAASLLGFRIRYNKRELEETF